MQDLLYVIVSGVLFSLGSSLIVRIANVYRTKARQTPATGAPHRKRITAGLLALFLGGLGVHKFYLGRNTIGLGYVLFCWTLIPAFLGVVDGVYLLLMTDAKFMTWHERWHERRRNTPTFMSELRAGLAGTPKR